MCHCDPDLSGEAILKGLGLLRQFLHGVQDNPRNDKKGRFSDPPHPDKSGFPLPI